MDLISREAAIEALNMNGCCGMGITYLLDCDSVPAVPLEPLCEWLADHYEPPANVSNGKALDDHKFCVTLWRYVIEKIMEATKCTSTVTDS